MQIWEKEGNVYLLFPNSILDPLLTIVMTFLVRECYGSPKKQEFSRIFKKFIDQPV
jgi:hypothetical protein